MADGAALRIALLARAGDAREQLKRAVSDLGAQIVVEADPNDLAPGALADSGATTVLVSVEPAVEAALDRLDAELMAPSLNVMFDEADTTAKLSGWDLNRWARHLAAKLVGCDVLPPGAEPAAHQEAADHLVPGVPTTPAALASAARMADFAAEINASAADVPSAYFPSDAPLTPPPVAEAHPVALDLDHAALEQAMAGAVGAEPVDDGRDLSGLRLLDDEPTLDRPVVASGPSVSLLAAREIDFGVMPLRPGPEADAGAPMDVEELSLSEAEFAAFGEGAGFRFGRSDAEPDATAGDAAGADDLAMDPELAKLAASFDESLELVGFEAATDEFAADFGEDFADFDRREAANEATRAHVEPPPLPDTSGLSLASEDDAPLAAPPLAAKPAFDFGALNGLALAPLDEGPSVPTPAVAGVAAPVVDVDHLSLSPLADEGGEPAPPSGTVLVLSGMGGPDAVRQLVRALPAGFPLAVLLQQNLDGGRHDRFVEQLAKVSRLPVALAEQRETPPPGAVRVLPEGLQAAGALAFPREGGMAALVAAATAQEGAVVVLSGADEAAIEPLKLALAAGVRVLVQDPASCFDGKVATALRDAGAPALPAGDMAARLDAHFPT